MSRYENLFLLFMDIKYVFLNFHVINYNFKKSENKQKPQKETIDCHCIIVLSLLNYIHLQETVYTDKKKTHLHKINTIPMNSEVCFFDPHNLTCKLKVFLSLFITSTPMS